MAEYWIYENWRAHGHVAKVHSAYCSHCKGGVGQAGGTDPANGRWLGPFATLQSAEAAGARTGSDVRRCGHCSRD